MTAKSETVGVVAKVAAYLVTEPGNVWLSWTPPDEAVARIATPLVPESALAECRLDYLAANNAALRWREMRDAIRAERDAILSGMEALAGEWEMRALEIDSYAETEFDHAAVLRLETAAERIRALIPAAANTESEETK